jgi:hypothetical protein
VFLWCGLEKFRNSINFPKNRLYFPKKLINQIYVSRAGNVLCWFAMDTDLVSHPARHARKRDEFILRVGNCSSRVHLRDALPEPRAVDVRL